MKIITNNIMKIIGYGIIVYTIFAINNNYNNLVLQKQLNKKMLQDTEQILARKAKILKTIQNQYAERLSFIAENKINLTKYVKDIIKILKDINTINGFHAVLIKKQLSKKYINVGLVKVRLATTLKNFTLKDFEQIFKKVFKQYGLVLPFKYSKDMKKATIYIVFLEQHKKRR